MCSARSDSVDSSETSRLLDEAREGDGSAFERAVRRHLPLVRRTVQRRFSPQLRARLDPSDVIQETQQEAFRLRDDFLARRPMPFRLWLLKTAHQRLLNIERDHLAAAKRQVSREVPLPDRSSLDIAAAIMGQEPSPSQQAFRRELAAKVRRALARLAEKDREILFLRNFEGLSNADVAAVLDLNPETTKKRYTRALLRLQAMLREDGITGADL